MAVPDLSIRITDDLATGRAERRIDVLDPDGNVLGSLVNSTGDVIWRMPAGGASVVTLEILAEHAFVESLGAGR